MILSIFNPYNLYKLFTHEDAVYYNLHKILGFSVLINYIFRTYNFFQTENNSLGFNGSFITLGSICLHMLLSGTSFIFKIPLKRNYSMPMIWPEFRIHSVLFAYRSLLIMLLLWLEQQKFIQNTILFELMRNMCVILTLYFADITTAYYKNKQILSKDDSTMRSMPFPKICNQEFIKYTNTIYN